MFKLGFLVNPIAGMGGKVGLKGTDGQDTVEKAHALGAVQNAPTIARQFLEKLYCLSDVKIFTCAGEMGEAYFSGDLTVVHEPGEPSTREDTITAGQMYLEREADIIVFVGGDGTAKDVASVVGDVTPVLGIPAGVKMYSSVFATGIEDAVAVLCEYITGNISLAEAEILDIDESKLRGGEADISLFGYVKTPFDEKRMQRSKSFSAPEEREFAKAIAEHITEEMDDRQLYILCPGMIRTEIANVLEFKESVLGIDVVKGRKFVGSDLNECALLDLLAQHENAKIVVTPIGRQGFIFGRGNQQVSADVIEHVGVENVVVVATPQKLANTPALFVHTGKLSLDEKLAGYVKIVNGYRNYEMREVRGV